MRRIYTCDQRFEGHNPPLANILFSAYVRMCDLPYIVCLYLYVPTAIAP